jgi:hypothetical protein
MQRGMIPGRSEAGERSEARGIPDRGEIPFLALFFLPQIRQVVRQANTKRSEA